MKIGYARVSTGDQSLDLQIDALKKYGCDEILTDTASGAKSDRPGLADAFKILREGDILVVWKLDRLGRSLKHLIEMMQEINNRKASFLSLQENIDTTSSVGKLIFHFISSLAEFERGLIIERTNAGLVAARARGRFGGRRFSCNQKDRARILELYKDKNIQINEICRMFNITRCTLYNYIRASSE